MTNLQPVTITSLTHEALAAKGYDISKISQSDLDRIAQGMAIAYLEQSFFDDLEIIADMWNLPRL